LPESFTVSDEPGKVAVTFTGTCGLSLLKNTLYNDDGDPYTDHDTFRSYIQTVQEKMLTWPRINELFTANTSLIRLYTSMSATSVDDQAYTTHPPSQTTVGYERMRVHNRTFHKRNTDGVNEYYSCYDVLDSICKTLGVSMGMNGIGLLVIAPELITRGVEVRSYRYNGSSTTGTYTRTEPFDGTLGNTTAFKGANWTRTYIAPVGKSKLTRLTQQSQGLIYGTNLSSGTTLNDADEIYNQGEEVTVRGSVRVTKSGDSSLSAQERLIRFVPEFKLELGTQDATQRYLNNSLYRNLTLNMTAVLEEITGLSIGTLQNTVQYANLMTTGPANGVHPYDWPTTESFYSHRVPMPDGRFFALHDAKHDIDVVIPFEFTAIIYNTQPQMQGASLTAWLYAYDYEGYIDTAYTNACTINFNEIGLYRRSKGDIQLSQSFDYVAKQDNGRTDIDYGQTLIGDRGSNTYFGGIQVYDGSDWIASTGWVNHDQDTARTVNQLAVEEICANHKAAKAIEKGTIVHDSQVDLVYWYARYKDITTELFYSPLRQEFKFTPQLTDVALLRHGRTYSAITVDKEDLKGPEDNSYTPPTQNDLNTADMFVDPGKPETQIYHNLARYNVDNWDTNYVVGGATVEYYTTITPTGFGRYIDYQGELVPADQKNVRRIYYNRQGLARDTTSGWTALTPNPADNALFTDVLETLQDFIATDTGRVSQITAIISFEQVDDIPFIVDDHAYATCAYGLRKLRENYTGNCIRIRRASDSALTDIGFTSDASLDEAAIASFCGSSAGYVTTWYDQAGNNRDVVQSSTASQPQIYTGSAVIKLNGKPGLNFDGVNDSLLASTNFNANANQTQMIVAWVGSVSDLTTGNHMVSHWNSSTANQNFVVQLTPANDNLRVALRYPDGSLVTMSNGSAISSGAQYIVVGQANTGANNAYFDGNEVTGTTKVGAMNSATTSFRIGARSQDGATPHRGITQEVIVWSRVFQDVVDDADDISTELNDYFNSY
jgi:hypothetical protein